MTTNYKITNQVNRSLKISWFQLEKLPIKSSTPPNSPETSWLQIIKTQLKSSLTPNIIPQKLNSYRIR